MPRGLGAQSHSDGQLAGSQCHGPRDQAVHADGRQQPRQGAEEDQYDHQQSRLGRALCETIAPGPDRAHRNFGRDRLQGGLNSRHSCRAIAGGNRQVEFAKRELACRAVDGRLDALAQGSVAHVMNHADDLEECRESADSRGMMLRPRGPIPVARMSRN